MAKHRLSPTGVVLCWACARAGDCRLGFIEETLVEPNGSLTKLVCHGDPHEGGPGVAHGGWTTEAFDEALGHLTLLMGKMSVTSTLTVKFIRPVPIDKPLEIRAWCDRVEDGRRYHRGELRLVSTGALLGSAEGVFVERDASHFAKFRTWLDSQEAAS
jgi:acyl-coenzyme A thioesterase PaaI-like protein